jgi:hypothetical protein
MLNAAPVWMCLNFRTLAIRDHPSRDGRLLISLRLKDGVLAFSNDVLYKVARAVRHY